MANYDMINYVTKRVRELSDEIDTAFVTHLHTDDFYEDAVAIRQLLVGSEKVREAMDSIEKYTAKMNAGEK